MKKGYRKERLKTLFIGLLFLTLLALMLANWVYDRNGLSIFPNVNAEEPVDLPVSIPEPARPALAAIARGGEFFAAGNGDAALGMVYDRFRTALGESLASAPERSAITRAAWEAALAGDCVYFEFLNGVPVWALAEGLKFTASPAVDGLTLKSVILSSGGLFVYGGGQYYRCGTVFDFSIPEQMESALYRAQFVNGAVVMDREYSYPTAVLTSRFTDEPYQSDLLTAMGFNPNTNFRYSSADGEMVFVDDQRTLHVGQDGRITYHDGTERSGEQFDVREAVRLCLNALPSGAAFWGDGRPTLTGIKEWDGGASIEFGYALNGAVFLDSRSVFVVEGTHITEAVVQLCPASLAGENVELMPQRQAAVLLSDGRELNLCYRESGGVWLPEWFERTAE